MKLPAEMVAAPLLLATLSAATVLAQTTSESYPPGSEGRPRGSSASGESERLDLVAKAEIDPALTGFRVTATGLVADETAELTAIDTGRIVLVMAAPSTGTTPPRISAEAASALGLRADGAVRIRRVSATAMDVAALRAGRAASPRLDAPEALLAGLRLKLPKAEAAGMAAVPAGALAQPAPAATVAAEAVTQPKLTPPPAAPKTGKGYLVRVAALSDRAKADRVARQLGGSVVASGKLHLVRIGPLPDRDAAAKARARAVASGFRDALVTQEK